MRATPSRFGVAVALLLMAGAPRASADEIDITGSWQVNLSCGGYADATSFLAFDEDVTTGSFASTAPSDCGTVALAGEAVGILQACVSTPNPATGQVSGTLFSLPASGTVNTDQDLANPIYWNQFGCTVTGFELENDWNGSIQDDGFGTATRITGQLVADDLTIKGCGFFGGPYTFCGFTMLRNEVAAGSNVTVTPNADVSVTFASVNVPGTASVTELNDPAAEIPPNFKLLGGVLPIFYDVATTATIDGAITTCIRYADANDDGIVDGTSLDETDLQVLHEEDEVFVDRTAGIDTVNNVVCAETTSLSQLVPGAPDAGGGGGGGGDTVDVPVSGVKVVLKRKPSGKEKVSWVSRDKFGISPPALGSADDPRTAGATFEVVSDAEGVDAYDLPAGNWFATNSGVLKYKGNPGTPVQKALIKEGKAIVVKTTETALPLAGPHAAVGVRLTTGDVRHCSRFGPLTIVKDEVDRFTAKGAKAGALLDCSDAALGIGSPSGAFLDAS
jgi:hypothetical protein